jgi:hypothetical protein
MSMQHTLSIYRRVLAILSLAISLCIASPNSQAQKTDDGSSFVIDANRPYAYVKFDHIGKGVKRSDEEPDLRIWLRLTNNCRLPIMVRTTGVPEGVLKDETGVMDIIVAIEPPRGPEIIGALRADGTVVGREPFVKATAGELPHDYWFEVGSRQDIEPGTDLLFSVPINHVGPRWSFEIPFEFNVVNGKFPRDPNVNGFPRMVFPYSMYDLPPNALKQVESWYNGASSRVPAVKSR